MRWPPRPQEPEPEQWPELARRSQAERQPAIGSSLDLPDRRPGRCSGRWLSVSVSRRCRACRQRRRRMRPAWRRGGPPPDRSFQVCRWPRPPAAAGRPAGSSRSVRGRRCCRPRPFRRVQRAGRSPTSPASGRDRRSRDRQASAPPAAVAAMRARGRAARPATPRREIAAPSPPHRFR